MYQGPCNIACMIRDVTPFNMQDDFSRKFRCFRSVQYVLDDCAILHT